jgi:hypothetical protein
MNIPPVMANASACGWVKSTVRTSALITTRSGATNPGGGSVSVEQLTRQATADINRVLRPKGRRKSDAASVMAFAVFSKMGGRQAL